MLFGRCYILNALESSCLSSLRFKSKLHHCKILDAKVIISIIRLLTAELRSGFCGMGCSSNSLKKIECEPGQDGTCSTSSI